MKSVECRESWIVASAVLAITTVAFGCAWITSVALTEIAKPRWAAKVGPGAGDFDRLARGLASAAS